MEGGERKRNVKKGRGGAGKREFTRQFGDILDFDVGKAPDENHLNLTRLRQMGHPADFPPSFPLRIALTYPFLSTTRGQRGKEKLIIVTSSFQTSLSR